MKLIHIDSGFISCSDDSTDEVRLYVFSWLDEASHYGVLFPNLMAYSSLNYQLITLVTTVSVINCTGFIKLFAKHGLFSRPSFKPVSIQVTENSKSFPDNNKQSVQRECWNRSKQRFKITIWGEPLFYTDFNMYSHPNLQFKLQEE